LEFEYLISSIKKNIGFYLFLPLAIFVGLNNLFNLDIIYFISLNPKILIQNNSLWTLITFPFAENSIIEFLLFSVIFLLYFPLLQSIYNKWFFPIFFFLFTLLEGSLLTIVFWNKDIYFQGLSAISSFILVVISFLYSKEKFVFGRLPVIKVSHFNLIIALFYFAFKLPIFIENDNNKIIATTAPLIFGIMVASAFYLQIYIYNKYILPKKRMQSIKEVVQLLTKARETVQALESTLVEQTTEQNQPNVKPYGNKLDKPIPTNKILITDDPEMNEELLNKILDKISERGLESLTQNEIEALRQLSSKI